MIGNVQCGIHDNPMCCVSDGSTGSFGSNNIVDIFSNSDRARFLDGSCLFP